jgi:integrase/recombinase XerD
MSTLQHALDDYLALHRALGFKLEMHGWMLQRFVEFAEKQGASYITTELALQWATQPARAQPCRWAIRLGVVRRFARYLSPSDPRVTIPPPDLLSARYQRAKPHIYRDEQIRRLVAAARQLRPAHGLRPHTYATLYALYAATGMRTAEALRLDRDDVDLLNGVLTIRHSKFDKSRYVPLHPSTRRALQRYAQHRDRLCRNPTDLSFFLSDSGTRLSNQVTQKTFVKLSRRIGLRKEGDSRGPRLLDLRHRFAIQTLLRWYRRGVDVERELPKLATYLGHVEITDTYWYLTATPQLLRYALNRLERSQRRKRS